MAPVQGEEAAQSAKGGVPCPSLLSGTNRCYPVKHYCSLIPTSSKTGLALGQLRVVCASGGLALSWP